VQNYANITLAGPAQAEIVDQLKWRGVAAYVSNTVPGDATVVFHEDLASQEPLAADLSEKFSCPAIVVMTYGQRVLLYQLYTSGGMTDSYVSEHVEELLGSHDAPPGDAEKLCDAFGKPAAIRRVAAVLSRPVKDGQPYAYAANRHGDLFAALKLPVFAVGASFVAIEHGELPAGGDFHASELAKTG
jgi:hypothetical protein